ncbi:hypothetical protein AURDEDRAFT_187222 [Auricularia subglabra TFB-10046 SS5]|nr:hypothetical protein AURDEDRAFT_187222 [Auricularia subglabra TFB-10046 SS5]
MVILDPPALLARAIILATAVPIVHGYTPLDSLLAIGNIGFVQRLLDSKAYSNRDVFILVLVLVIITRLLVVLSDTALGCGIFKLTSSVYRKLIQPPLDVVVSKITEDPPKSCAIVIALVLAYLAVLSVQALYRACTFANLLYVGYDLPVTVVETVASCALNCAEVLVHLSLSAFEYAFGLTRAIVMKSVNSACDLLLVLLHPAYLRSVARTNGDRWWMHPSDTVFEDFIEALRDSRNAPDLYRAAAIAIVAFWLTDISKAFWNLFLCGATHELHPLWLNGLVDALEHDVVRNDDSPPTRGPRVRTLSHLDRFFIALVPLVARIWSTYACFSLLCDYEYRVTVWPVLYVAARLEIIDRGRCLFWLPRVLIDFICAVVPVVWDACVYAPLASAFTTVYYAARDVLGVASAALLVFLGATHFALVAASATGSRVQGVVYERSPSAAECQHVVDVAVTQMRTFKRGSSNLVMSWARETGYAVLDFLRDLDPTVPRTDSEKKLGRVHFILLRLLRAVPFVMFYVMMGFEARQLAEDQRQRQQAVVDTMNKTDDLLRRPRRAFGIDFPSVFGCATRVTCELENGKRPGWFAPARSKPEYASLVAWWGPERDDRIAALRACLADITEVDLVADPAAARVLNASAHNSQRLLALRSLLAEIVDDGKPVETHVSYEEQLKAISDPSNPAYVDPNWRWRFVQRAVPISFRKRLAYRLRNIEPPTQLVELQPGLWY